MSKSRDSHLTLELLLQALQGKLPLAAVVARAHDHLLASCRKCREEWDRRNDGGLPVLAEEATDEYLTSGADVEHSIERLATRRRLFREAEEDVNKLLALPLDEWQPKVERARSRFRSRAFAQRLLEECSAKIRDSPEIAERLAGMVSVALLWAITDGRRPWAHAMIALAEANRANALRVRGDLAASAKLFARLSRNVESAPWKCPKTRGEIESLHASLLVEQGRYGEAEARLLTAGEWFQEAESDEGVARVLTARANLAGVLGDAYVSFHLHTEAAGRVDRIASPSVYLGSVTGRVLALGEMGQVEEGKRLLKRYREVYEDHGGAYGRAHVRCLEGRLAFAENDYERAVEKLLKGRVGFMALGRTHDAALASLDLALAYYSAGETAKAEELACELVTVFTDLGVPRDILASLRLLNEAGSNESAKIQLAREVNRLLQLQALCRG